MMIVVVIGGILGGIFTATEASAIAVVYSFLILGMCYKNIKINHLPAIFLATAKMTAIVILMLATSSIMSWVMAFTKIPAIIASGLLSFTDSFLVILLIMDSSFTVGWYFYGPNASGVNLYSNFPTDLCSIWYGPGAIRYHDGV